MPCHVASHKVCAWLVLRCFTVGSISHDAHSFPPKRLNLACLMSRPVQCCFEGGDCGFGSVWAHFEGSCFEGSMVVGHTPLQGPLRARDICLAECISASRGAPRFTVEAVAARTCILMCLPACVLFYGLMGWVDRVEMGWEGCLGVSCVSVQQPNVAPSTSASKRTTTAPSSQLCMDQAQQRSCSDGGSGTWPRACGGLPSTMQVRGDPDCQAYLLSVVCVRSLCICCTVLFGWHS